MQPRDGDTVGGQPLVHLSQTTTSHSQPLGSHDWLPEVTSRPIDHPALRLPSCAVPQRTNVFQVVVAVIHQHMAGDAVVEESSFLPHRVTGRKREVDVVVRTKVSGYEVIVSVEATATGRRADTKWVEALIQKHRDLPTSKLVLVSQAGLTPDARREAVAEGAIPLALWPKVIKLEPASADAIVRKPDGSQHPVPNLLPDQSVFLSDGRLVGMLRDVLGTLYMANFPKLAQEWA